MTPPKKKKAKTARRKRNVPQDRKLIRQLFPKEVVEYVETQLKESDTKDEEK